MDIIINKCCYILILFSLGCGQGFSKKGPDERRGTIDTNRSALADTFYNKLDTLIIDSHMVVFETLNEEEYNELERQLPAPIIKKDSLFGKVDGRLKFPTAIGNILLQDENITSETDFKKFNYEGFLMSRFYLVTATNYETSEMLIVDRVSGKTTSAWAYPFLNPSNTYMMVYSNNYDYGILPNGIQLFEIEQNELKPFWELKIDDWKPVSAAWLNDKTILVKKVVEVLNSNLGSDKTEYLLIRI